MKIATGSIFSFFVFFFLAAYGFSLLSKYSPQQRTLAPNRHFPAISMACSQEFLLAASFFELYAGLAGQYVPLIFSIPRRFFSTCFHTL
jgi:hypothetical protein